MNVILRWLSYVNPITIYTWTRYFRLFNAFRASYPTSVACLRCPFSIAGNSVWHWGGLLSFTSFKMLELDNANCILVKFVNKHNKLAVEYWIWFVDKNLIDDDHLDEVIRHEITIQILWPNCDVKSASSMKKVIKNLNKDDWIEHAVKVHSYGGM